MIQIAQVFLFDRHNRLLIYLRDDKPEIPFPNHWDLFGGHVEEGETPEQALVREVKEELGVHLLDWRLFRIYECTKGDAYPNQKFIYYARIEQTAEELTLHEGQRLAGIEACERRHFKFANILADILRDFITAGHWPQPVDNSSAKFNSK
jgi:8-oxo-dGTP diphosphatase